MGRRIAKPVLFVCDIQERFRNAIYGFSNVVSTAQKMIKASEILEIPIYATTQSRKVFGDNVDELGLETPTSSKTAMNVVDKTSFSMWVPEIAAHVGTSPSPSTTAAKDVIIVGIESHICVTQTALDLVENGHRVYVLADGVSSCNREEVPIALRRLAAEEHVTVTTSESVLYEIMGDAKISQFKAIAGLVKESKTATTEALQALCKI